MAKIRIYFHEASGEDFPRMCMKCGARADCDVPQTFSWMPGWVTILIVLFMCVGFLGFIVWIITALTTRKTMSIVAPMCYRHQGHWRVRKLYTWLGLLFWIGYLVALVALGSEIPKDVLTPLIVVGLIGAFLWLISALLIMNGAIKAIDIRDRWMELVNVNRDFADAWNDMIDDGRPERPRGRPRPRQR
jgi:hypothetical protein